MTYPTPPVTFFSGDPINRAGERRAQTDWIDAQLANPSSRLFLVRNGQPLLEASEGSLGQRLILWLSASARGSLARNAPWMFVGVDDSGDACFAADITSKSDPTEDGPLEGMGAFEDLRAASQLLPPGEASLIGTAKSLLDWHARHRFCSNCGTETEAAEAGWKRACPSCKTEHFPRTDPVVIMLAIHKGRALLGRQPRFPRGMMSALAGFIEPGETIEEAAGRELKEEANLNATSARIVTNQPWPFPCQLMIGLHVEVDGDDATPDPSELESVRWFTKDEARAMLEGGLVAADGRFWAPPPMAIAHTILRAWVDEA